MSSPRKKQSWIKERQVKKYEEISSKYFIFCEGEQTEPLYFSGFKDQIEQNAIYKNSVLVKVEGVGKETIRVLEAAQDYVSKFNINNANIWCVYDKDSFPSEDFNKVSQLVKQLNNKQTSVKYFVAWSNQCIEYWFILHFDYYDSDNDRKYYRQFLHKKFKELGWDYYEKNNQDLFNILVSKGNPKLAIKYAKKRIKECDGLSDAESVPATNVHELVMELAKFLPEEMKCKIL